MSSQSIARWNAIPLERTSEPAAPTSLKRGRPDDDQGSARYNNDDDDDDISLVSRSPSPLHDPMDVDEANIHKYDEYVRRPTREVITVDTKLKPTNKGFALLTKLGWKEGQPVGLSGEGRTEPIPFHVKSDLTGLGKTSQDVRMIEETVSQRRELEAERQQKESEEQRKQREDIVARKNALESEISSTLRAFYCTLCDKQFKNVAQYDEHTNSYAHHHKARFKDMQANARLNQKDEIDKRKEKERKREEKELRKIAAANGIKMPKVTASLSPAIAPVPASNNNPDTNMDIDGTPIVEPKSNWATITSAGGSSSASGGFSKGGWATVGPSSSASAPVPVSESRATRFGSPSVPSASTNSHHAGANPTFRNAGWTSLDTATSSAQNPPALPPAPNTSYYNEPAPPPPPPEPSRGGWSRVSKPTPAPPPSEPSPSRGGWARATTSNEPVPPPPPEQPSFRGGWAKETMSSPAAPPPPPPPSNATPLQPPTAPVENKPVRSSWQQFQKGVGRRK